MIRGMYTIRDEASALYMDIQMNVNHDMAIRNFDYAMAKNDMMGFRPEDFSLWYIGDYDDATAVINPKDPLLLKRGVKNAHKK